ncbi:MAG: hypothetical protein ING65_10120 [Rhodocyclaceae bacterium]|nr:hypothetical protein [Rhodocyclaceae bacterium]
MIFGNQKHRASLVTFFYSLVLIPLVGCASRKFNSPASNKANASQSSAESEVEVCGKVHNPKNDANIQIIRLNPKSATLLTSKKSSWKGARYAQIDLSALQDGEQRQKKKQCLNVGFSGDILVASKSRDMDAEELLESFEFVMCGKLKDDDKFFKFYGPVIEKQKVATWAIERNPETRAKLEEISLNNKDVCVIGKPILFEEGLAIIVDEHSYVVHDETKK